MPDDFGAGLVIPSLKSENLDSTVSDNRAITISPCVSNVFEMCLMHMLMLFFVACSCV